MENQTYSLIDVLKTVSREKKTIIITTLLAGVITAIISLIVPVYYQANTSFYAASPDLGKPNGLTSTDEERKVYGNDYDIDRLLSIAESEALYQFLIDSFDLYNHYDVDRSNPKSAYYLRLELKDNYKVLKTKLGAVQLSVEDEDPTIASKMANAARRKIDELSQSVMKKSQFSTLESMENGISLQEKLLHEISDSLKFYREKYNVINTRSQGEVFSKMITSSKSKYQKYLAYLDQYKKIGKRDSIKHYTVKTEASLKALEALQGEFLIFNEGSVKVHQLDDQYKRMSGQLSLDRQRRDLLKSAYANEFKAIHTIERASPPVIKSKPKRALMVISFSLIVFILSIAFVLIKHNTKDFAWQEIWNAK